MSSIRVDAWVDLDDVFDEISTDQLLKEIKRRREEQAGRDVEVGVRLLAGSLDELRTAIRERRHDDALVLLDRIFAPRFADVSACRQKYNQALEARTQ